MAEREERPIDLSEQPEKAILVGIDRGNTEWPLEESLNELERLTNTAGGVVVGRVTQRIQTINPRTFIGGGKAEEVAELARTLDCELIVFDDELTPTQQTNLEKICPECKVIDRTALILDIFALHATSREGRLQVRLAQNRYLLPRLRGMWAHLASNRMGGGVGSRFGEGESQLEVDRRMVRKRITSIQRELETLSKTRDLQRKSRRESGIYRIALTGYTNAGKSSLLNLLCGTNVLVYDKLFATLDSTTRKLVLSEGRTVTLTDTVGFIQKLPHSLVEAFKSTLDEISQSNLILQITDASSEQREAQMEAVQNVLAEIGAAQIPTVQVFNKVDLLSDEQQMSLSHRYQGAVLVSACTGYGMDSLMAALERAYSLSSTTMEVLVPFSRGDMVELAHKHCDVLSETYTETGTTMTLLVSEEFVTRFKPFMIEADV